MNKIWFTSDTHFNHENVIEYSERPFFDLKEMTRKLIMNWNSVVSDQDTVYHLGDFALSWGKKDLEAIEDILWQLNGTKHLIKGNHDRKEVYRNSHWESVQDYLELKLDMGGVHKQKIVLCHYPLRVWNQIHRGAWHLHGHSHGSLVEDDGLIMDVGVDVNDYTPINLDHVRRYMETRTLKTFDHHAASDTSTTNDVGDVVINGRPIRSQYNHVVLKSPQLTEAEVEFVLSDPLAGPPLVRGQACTVDVNLEGSPIRMTMVVREIDRQTGAVTLRGPYGTISSSDPNIPY